MGADGAASGAAKGGFDFLSAAPSFGDWAMPLPPISLGFAGGDAGPSQAISGITSSIPFANTFVVGSGASASVDTSSDARGGDQGGQATGASPYGGPAVASAAGGLSGLGATLGALDLMDWLLIAAIVIGAALVLS